MGAWLSASPLPNSVTLTVCIDGDCRQPVEVQLGAAELVVGEFSYAAWADGRPTATFGVGWDCVSCPDFTEGTELTLSTDDDAGDQHWTTRATLRDHVVTSRKADQTACTDAARLTCHELRPEFPPSDGEPTPPNP